MALPHSFVVKSVCGHLSTKNVPLLRKEWNDLFRKGDIDAFFDLYRINKKNDIQLRLSEMFVHGRIGYSIAEELQQTIMPLLDESDVSAQQKGRVDTIVNNNGVLCGYFVGEEEIMKRQCALWLSNCNFNSDTE